MTHTITNKVTNYKGYVIIMSSYSHCAFVNKDGNAVKYIAGDISSDGTNNAIEKAKQYIDNL